VAGFIELAARGFFVGAIQFDFEEFPYVHGVDAIVSHVFKGALDCFALGINDGLFGGDDDFGFHVRTEQTRETSAADVGECATRTPVFFVCGRRLKSPVETPARAGNIAGMKLLCAFAVWIGMGVVLGSGILMAVKGNPWLLIAGFVGLAIAVGKIGCATH